MTVVQLVQRLLCRRPLMFMTPVDLFLLRGGQDGDGRDAFDRIGTPAETAPHILAELQSYVRARFGDDHVTPGRACKLVLQG